MDALQLPAKELDEIRPIETLFRLCRRPKVVLDVGAGEGFYAIGFRIFYPGAKILCFEPIDANYLKLTNNAEALSCEPIKLALGETNGEIEMYVTELTECSSPLRPIPVGDQTDKHWALVRRETAHCRRLDDWMVENKISPADVDILKMDTQGSELSILRGAPELLRAKPIIMLEVTYPTHYEGQPTPEEIEAFMCEAGYRLECAHPSDTMPDLWNDSIYVPRGAISGVPIRVPSVRLNPNSFGPSISTEQQAERLRNAHCARGAEQASNIQDARRAEPFAQEDRGSTSVACAKAVPPPVI